MESTERRKRPRHRYPIEVVIAWGSKTIEACTQNISLTGMFIEITQPLWLHAEFTVRLSLPKPIKLDCVVKRVEPGRGMGVEFKHPPEAEREQLALLVAGLDEKSRHTVRPRVLGTVGVGPEVRRMDQQDPRGFLSPTVEQRTRISSKT